MKALHTLAAVMFAMAMLTDRPQVATAFAVLMVVLQLQNIGEILERHFEDEE